MKAKTVWISDVHLGTELCQYEKLLAFLKSFETEDKSGYNLETLYLNGDIIDIVQMNHKLFWSKHRVVLKKLLRMADKGVKIIYILGNHEQPLRNDVFLQEMYNINLNGITIKSEDEYISIIGDRYLVMHGDEFDGVVRMNPYLYKLGDLGYKILTKINKFQNWCRRLVGMKEWSFSLWIKTRVKEAIKFLNNFEILVVEEARRRNARGVINGHVHVLSDKEFDGVRYLNSGTWAEFCSYIIEHYDGTIEAKYYE